MHNTNVRVGRLITLYILFVIIGAVLLGRLFLLMSFPRAADAGDGRAVRVPRWQLDEEHFHLQLTSDARGWIEFQNGHRWQPRRLTEQRGGTSASPALVAPEIVGSIGLPDIWPSPDKVVAEQGRSGLEYAFDPILSGRRPGVTGHVVAAKVANQTAVRALPPTAFTLTPMRGKNVVTTIDESRQRLAETLLQKTGARHASIVSLSLRSDDIQVLASANHQASDALRAVAPGSIFKLVTAAAALETHTYSSNARFSCRGFVRLPHVDMHCWRVHGQLSLRQAIAESCDVTFATIGAQLGRIPMFVQAQRFGILETGIAPYDGKEVIVGADAGVVYKQSGSDLGLLANTAIGQEDVRMSPLQGAVLAAAIAKRGEHHRARLVKGFTDDSGRFTPLYPDARDTLGLRACSAFTASVLADGMWAAVHRREGTAYLLHPFPIAAKTGTAELPNGHVNAWLIGYQVHKGIPVSAFAICVADEPSWLAHKHLYQLAAAWFKSC
ncbi:penicillin-binding transpeptidase domain-containing protein [Alicyclobacillus fastidiosus]|uniref:Penicillin-binding transpeptidase domain-containing protein n=1 Tax=Alicyclobacillus fastidiosus TaxID=392011 RepID=A0ABV5ACK4_9BACL|nr:penicillin-binding transpeptidase domain-containing protein [Alicyclobacillus fastidiosus]WEH11309.1 penicillin-binding transpeptidase domain-containing protein [Alicyclobacillus fastidiosus]